MIPFFCLRLEGPRCPERYITAPAITERDDATHRTRDARYARLLGKSSEPPSHTGRITKRLVHPPTKSMAPLRRRARGPSSDLRRSGSIVPPR